MKVKYPGEMSLNEMIIAIKMYFRCSEKEAKRKFEILRSEEKTDIFWWWIENCQ